MGMIARVHKAAFKLNNSVDYGWKMWARLENTYTPDIQKLQQYRFQYLFVCDEMMAGRHLFDERLGIRAAKVCSAFTQDDFTMWKWPALNKTEVIPMSRSFLPQGVKTRDATPPWADFKPGLPFRILGQLHIVRPIHFLRLDKWKQNGIQFYRKRIPLLIPQRIVTRSPHDGTVVHPEELRVIHAWMYIGKHDFYSELLGTNYHGYCSVKTHLSKRAQIGRFYFFDPTEYNA